MSAANIVFGRHPVIERLERAPGRVRQLLVLENAASKPLARAIMLAESHGISIERCPRHQLDRLTGGANHQGLVLRVAAFQYTHLDDLLASLRGARDNPPLLVAVDGLQDPGNLGSIVRSAFALGAQGLLLPQDRTVQITPAVIKTAAGATEHLPIARVGNLKQSLRACQDAGFWITGLSGEVGQALSSLDLVHPMVLVVGAEGGGLRPTVAKMCDHLASIPMAAGAESLNAAVACAIALYEVARQCR